MKEVFKHCDEGFSCIASLQCYYTGPTPHLTGCALNMSKDCTAEERIFLHLLQKLGGVPRLTEGAAQLLRDDGS